MNLFFPHAKSPQSTTTPTLSAPLFHTINPISFHDIQWKPKIATISDISNRASLPTESAQPPLTLSTTSLSLSSQVAQPPTYLDDYICFFSNCT